METPTSIFKVINGLRHFGVGAKVTRNTYKAPNTYWIVTKVSLSKDQDHGKVWGRLVWNGRPKEKNIKIGAPLKKEWLLLDTPDYRVFRNPEVDIKHIIPELTISDSNIVDENN